MTQLLRTKDIELYVKQARDDTYLNLCKFYLTPEGEYRYDEKLRSFLPAKTQRAFVRSIAFLSLLHGLLNWAATKSGKKVHLLGVPLAIIPALYVLKYDFRT